MKHPFCINRKFAGVLVMAMVILVATGIVESGRRLGQGANANPPQGALPSD